MRLILALIWAVAGVIDFDRDEISAAALSQDPLVRLNRKCQTHFEATLQRTYFVIKSVSKRKRQAFLATSSNYRKTIKFLTKRNLIGSESLIVHSPIKPKYLPKKRAWSFSIVFMLSGIPTELSTSEIGLKRFGVQKLQD